MKNQLFRNIAAALLAVFALSAGAHGLDPNGGQCGDNAYYSIAGSTLTIQGTGAISNNAFYYADLSGIEEVQICEGITSVGEYAFRQATSFQLLRLPASLTTIGYEAFYGVENLVSVSLASGSQLETIGGDAFSETSITSFAFPSSLKTIGEGAFRGCESLTSVILQDGFETIGDYAFYGCSELKNVIIPSTVRYIGDYAFYNCKQLRTPSFSGTGNVPLTIGNCAFNGCAITSLLIPARVTSIGNSAFDTYNASLNSVTIASGSQLQSIGEYAFSGISRFTTITLPCPLLSSIGEGAFAQPYKELMTIYCLTETALTVGETPHYYANSDLTVYMYASKKVEWPGIQKVRGLFTLTAGDGVSSFSGTKTYEDYYAEDTEITVSTTVNNPVFFVDGYASEATALGDGQYTVRLPIGVSHDAATISAITAANFIDVSTATVTVNDECVWHKVFDTFTPSLTVVAGGETLLLNSDYTVTYANNDRPGTASYTITGKGRCTGTLTGTFVISAATSGEWRDIPWSYDESTATLTFTGSGPLSNCNLAYAYDAIEKLGYPWCWFNNDVRHIVFDNRITMLPGSGFRDFVALEDIAFTEGEQHLDWIAEYAFYGCIKLDNVTLPPSTRFVGAQSFYQCWDQSSTTAGLRHVTIEIDDTNPLRVMVAAFNNNPSDMAIQLKYVGNVPRGMNFDGFVVYIQDTEDPGDNSISDLNLEARTALLHLAHEYSVDITAVLSGTPIPMVALSGVSFAEGQNWASWYGENDLALPDGLTAWVVTAVNGDQAVVESVGYIPASTGVLLYSETPGDDYEAEYYDGTPATVTSMLAGSTDGMDITNGWVLYNNAFISAEDGTLPAHRCYLPQPEPGNAPRLLRIVTGGTTTGIAGIAAGDVKSVRYFNLQGVELRAPADGINIIVIEHTDGSITTSKVLK